MSSDFFWQATDFVCEVPSTCIQYCNSTVSEQQIALLLVVTRRINEPERRDLSVSVLSFVSKNSKCALHMQRRHIAYRSARSVGFGRMYWCIEALCYDDLRIWSWNMSRNLSEITEALRVRRLWSQARSWLCRDGGEWGEAHSVWKKTKTQKTCTMISYFLVVYMCTHLTHLAEVGCVYCMLASRHP